MTSTPTATSLLDGYLAARAATARQVEPVCREVIGSLRCYVEAQGAMPIDDLTARRLRVDAGREPTEHELAAVLSVIEHVTGFFQSRLLGATDDALGPDLADAADVVRDLAGWLAGRRLIDDDLAEHLGRYTHLYDGDQATGT